jgi:hypothetical protein
MNVDDRVVWLMGAIHGTVRLVKDAQIWVEFDVETIFASDETGFCPFLTTTVDGTHMRRLTDMERIVEAGVTDV